MEIHEIKKNSSYLEVRSLKKVFGKKEAVRDISFTMRNGEVVGLLGPNGAGKTTCFYMIAGFIPPTDGQIILNDVNITRMPMYLRALEGIAYLPQEPSVFRKLTVEDNVMAILETRPELDRVARQEKLETLLTDLGIDRVRDQMAYTLSGGERRRTEIARALAIEPHFLLLDEPFAGIDPIAVHDIKKIIGELAAKNIGVLITDHNVRETLEITSRALIINLGEVLISGTHNELLGDEKARKLYLGENFRM